MQQVTKFEVYIIENIASGIRMVAFDSTIIFCIEKFLPHHARLEMKKVTNFCGNLHTNTLLGAMKNTYIHVSFLECHRLTKTARNS